MPRFSQAAATKDSTNNLLEESSFEDDSVSCVIPFTRVGNLIIIKAKADSVEGNFILDTGAPYLILNIVYFRKYPATTISDESQTSLSGIADVIQRTKLRQFSMGALDYFQKEADLADLGHLENRKGIKILGLIGLKLLARCEMIVDYENSLIYMHRIGRKERRNFMSIQLAADTAYTTLPIDIVNDKIIAQTEVDNKKFRFVMDSGAETNIIDSRLPNSFFENVPITGRFNIRGTGSTTVEALQGNLNHMKLGNNELRNLPVLIANLERTCFSVSTCANGVLGFEFMPLRKIGFNFVSRKMYLWKSVVPI